MLVFKKNVVSKIVIVFPESFRKHVLQIIYINLFFSQCTLFILPEKIWGYKTGV